MADQVTTQDAEDAAARKFRGNTPLEDLDWALKRITRLEEQMQKSGSDSYFHNEAITILHWQVKWLLTKAGVPDLQPSEDDLADKNPSPPGVE